MVVVNPTEDGHDETYSPQSPGPSEPSPTSTPSMNLSTIEGWETPHTTRDDNTIYSPDETRRIYFLPSSSSPPPPLRKLKENRALECPSQKRGSVAPRLPGLWKVAP